MANYDITFVISKSLDIHLVFPLLEFIHSKNIYSEEEILQKKLELLNQTNMIDF